MVGPVLGVEKFGRVAVQSGGTGLRELDRGYVREGADFAGHKVPAWPGPRPGRAGG